LKAGEIMQKPPRIKVPGSVKAGELIEVKTLATHVMETGNRKDPAGKVIPRDIIHTFTATFEGQEVFAATLGSGVAANPYIAFFLKVPGAGTLELTWLDDQGVKTIERVALQLV
jgi:sulfur-oxidizing protein SoxZ